jgi:hypothetical protein
LNNEELIFHVEYHPGYNIKEDQTGEVCGTHWREDKCIMGKPEAKRNVERPRHKWEDNMKMDLEGIGWDVWAGFVRFGTERSVGLL